jgi:hypothetical protein
MPAQIASVLHHGLGVVALLVLELYFAEREADLLGRSVTARDPGQFVIGSVISPFLLVFGSLLAGDIDLAFLLRSSMTISIRMGQLPN